MQLTKGQKIALDLLAKSPVRDTFYWTGGTLLAVYYLHHRFSKDLDFFSEKPFNIHEVTKFIEELKEKGDFKTVSYQKIFDRYEFILKNKEQLRIEFVWYNHEKKTLKMRRRRYLGVFIDSLEDIAANKVMALMDRNEAKDLFDIYFLITKAKFAPKKLLQLMKKKFGLSITEITFWGECMRSLKKLHSLHPFLPHKEKREKLLQKIDQFIIEKARVVVTKAFI